MKQVWVNAATCSCTASTTCGAALPTLTTAIPEPRSISELPSTSTSTPPPARSTNSGTVPPTADDTAAVPRARGARERRRPRGHEPPEAGPGQVGDQPPLLRQGSGRSEHLGHRDLPVRLFPRAT